MREQYINSLALFPGRTSYPSSATPGFGPPSPSRCGKRALLFLEEDQIPTPATQENTRLSRVSQVSGTMSSRDGWEYRTSHQCFHFSIDSNTLLKKKQSFLWLRHEFNCTFLMMQSLTPWSDPGAVGPGFLLKLNSTRPQVASVETVAGG